MTPADVRLVGFGSRAPLAAALAWIEANAALLPAETVPVQDAVGRVLVVVPAGNPWPAADRAGLDGYAVCAAETEGASDYAPLALRHAELVVSGGPMPPGTDAILPHAGVRSGAVLEALAVAARSAGLERQGAEGAAPLPGPLRREGMALLALLGVPAVEAVRRPRVALVVAGPKSGPDVLTPLLQTLVGRDGGLAAAANLEDAGQDAANAADMILLAGRTGCGGDDDMPQRFAAAGGMLDLHGIAFRPGDTAGLGRLGSRPAVLLPGSPLSALSVYEALAGPAVRRLGGRTSPSHVERQAVLERKITSAIGCTDMVRVRLRDGRATPLGPADTGGLGRAASSDGWVIVPDGQEGYPAGATVTVQCPA